MRRGRRTTRWRSCLGSAIRAGRRSTGSRVRGTDRAIRLSGDAADARRSQRAAADRPRACCRRRRAPRGLQLQRSEDRGPAARPRAYRRRAGRKGGAAGMLGAQLPRRRSPTSAPASSASSSRPCSTGRSKRRGGWARAASASPAAFRRTAGLRADAEARGRRLGLPVFVPPLSLSTDNAAMIGAAAAPAARGRAGPGTSTRSVGAECDLRRFKRASASLRQLCTLTRTTVMAHLHRLPLVQHQKAAGVHPDHR